LNNYISKNKSLDLSDFANSLPKELFDGFAQIALKDEEDLAESADEFEKEFKLVKYDLMAVGIKEKLSNLEKEIKEEEEKESSKKLESLKEKFDSLIKDLAEIRQYSEDPTKKVLLD
jgi:hypothetical protein